MSYTPTTWTTGDTITATKLNKLEQGVAGAGSVASVVVDFNNGGISGSVVCYLGYVKYISSQGVYSIESLLNDYIAVTPHARIYIPVCLPSSNDEYKPYILFGRYLDESSGYTISGNISSTKIGAQVRASASTWLSEFYYGFEVTGDGEIDVYYQD